MLAQDRPSHSSNANAGSKAAIRFVDPATEPRWDERLSQFSGCTLFHSSVWSRILKDSYGFRPCYILAEQGGHTCGVLPLMEADSWPKGRRGISLPFTDECPVLSAAPHIQNEMVGAAMEEGRRRGWKYLERRGISEHFADSESSGSFY